MSETLITELPLTEASSEIPQMTTEANNDGASPKQQLSGSLSEENESVSSDIKIDEDALTESPSIFDTWVAAAKKEEEEQKLLSTTNQEAEHKLLSNSNTSSNELASTGGSQEQKNVPRPPKMQKIGQRKGISKVHKAGGDPNVVALEARVAERRAADKLREEKIRKKIHTMESERVRKEAELAELKITQAEAVRQAKEEEFRRKHEEHLAAETARKVRCNKLLNCDMDIINGKKSVTARFEGRKAELKEIEEEDLVIAKCQRHETFAAGKDFYDKLRQHETTVKAKVEVLALDRTSRKLDMPPLPLEYMHKVRTQFLQLEAKRKAENTPDLSMTVSQGKRSNMIQYAQAVQREIRPTMRTVPMVFEEEKKTVPRAALTTKDRMKDGNMAIHHGSGSVSPSQRQHTCWAHS